MYKNELEIALKAAKAAATLIMKYYNKDYTIETKEDNSPITTADKKADKLILEILKEHFPHHAFLSEESIDDDQRLQNDYLWIIDPIDGTKDFIAKTGEFATNIALAYKKEVVVGVIMAPAKNEIYYASKGNGSYRLIDGKIIQNKTSNKEEKLIVLRSNFHRKKIEDDFLKTIKDLILRQEPRGSSYKACLIASGEADYMLKVGPGTKEWDTAASDLIVSEAGGYFADAFGNKYCYNRQDYNNYKGFVIMNKFNPKLIYKKA